MVRDLLLLQCWPQLVSRHWKRYHVFVAFDIAAAAGDLRVLIWQQVLAVRWQPIPTFDGLTRFRTIQSRHIRSLAGKKAVIISYSNASGNDLHFDPGSRDLVAAVMNDAKTHTMGMAQVIAGDGFGAASVRSVLSGIQLSVRPDYPVKLFRDAQSAFRWLEDILDEAGCSELAPALDEMLTELEHIESRTN